MGNIKTLAFSFFWLFSLKYNHLLKGYEIFMAIKC